jgi:photosynthetic reaction center cytochrome c subunit
MTRTRDNFGWYLVAAVLGVAFSAWILWAPGWDLPPVNTQQTGFRGTAMEQIYDREHVAKLAALNAKLPDSLVPSGAPGPKVSEIKDVYKNVQILGDLTEEQFTSLMSNMALWVAGDGAACDYCHNVENMADDSKYQLKVARKMILMTRTINSKYKSHVAETGVTCYTCHRGQNVPQYTWYQEKAPVTPAGGMLGWRNGQNIAAKNAGETSLPQNHLADFLLGDKNIRVHTLQALPDRGNKQTIMDTEWTYALMIHMSEALGVNCTFCHNSAAFYDWQMSPPQRVTAWHGIRMARDVNNTYIEPLKPVFPANRVGPMGDPAKVNCLTCHQGINKPLNGQSMLKDFKLELGGAR